MFLQNAIWIFDGLHDVISQKGELFMTMDNHVMQGRYHEDAYLASAAAWGWLSQM
jgi:hypothetical protein